MLTDLFANSLMLAQTAEATTSAAGLAGENLKFVIIWGSIVAIIAIFGLVEIIKSTNREKTHREIAAYVAEGTMTTEEGERLIKARSKGTC